MRFLPTWILTYGWLIELSFFIVLIFSFNYYVKFFLVKFKKRSNLNPADWRFSIDQALLLPLQIALWIFFVEFLFDLSARYLEIQNKIPTLGLLRNVGLIICLAWWLLRWKDIFIRAVSIGSLSERPFFKSKSVLVIGKIVTIAIIFISLLLILQVFGLNIGPLIAFGGIGAAALGFASKDAIANFYGGLMIHIASPFTINDLIELPHKQIQGDVEEIGWYFTTIRNKEKRPIYIPNSVFATEYLINLSRMTHRRIEEQFRVRYTDVNKIEHLLKNIRQLLAHHSSVDVGLPIEVYITSFGESSIEFEAKAYTYTTRYDSFMEIKQELILKIHQIFREAAIDIPCPMMEVVIRQEV